MITPSPLSSSLHLYLIYRILPIERVLYKSENIIEDDDDDSPISIKERERERKRESSWCRRRTPMINVFIEKSVCFFSLYWSSCVVFLSTFIVISFRLRYENASGNQISLIFPLLSSIRNSQWREIIPNDFDTIMGQDRLVNMCQKAEDNYSMRKKIIYRWWCADSRQEVVLPFPLLFWQAIR